MYNSKLLKLIETFSKGEWHRARQYVLLENERASETAQLFEYIAKFRNDLTAKPLSLDIMHKKLFPAKTRKAAQNVMSKLNKSLEDYLTWTWLKENKNEADVLFLRAVRERGLFDQFDKRSRDLKSRIRKGDHVSFWDDYHLHVANHFMAFSNHPDDKIEDTNAFQALINSYVQMVDNWTTFYKSIHGYYKVIYKYNHDDSDDLLDNLKIKSNKTTHYNYYTEYLKLVQDADESSFLKLYNFIQDTSIQLEFDIERLFHMALTRHVTSKVKIGEKSPVDISRLYEIGIEKKILLLSNQMTHRSFANYVNVMAACGELDKAFDFLDKYGMYLSQDVREDTLAICRAQILFYDGQFEEVVEQLNRRSYIRFLHTLRMRWLLLCSQFMLHRNDQEFMKVVIRNFNNYIRNNQERMSQNAVEGSLNLSKIIQLLIKDYSKTLLLDELKKDKNIVFRSWLIQIANKM